MIVVAVYVEERARVAGHMAVAAVIVVHVVCAELLHFGGDPFDLLKVIGEGVVQRQEHVVVVHVMMNRGMDQSVDQIRSRD